MSGTFGGSSGTVQTQGTNTPWSGVQPYLLDAFQKAQANYNTQSAPGSIVNQAQGAVGSTLNAPLDPSQNPNFKASVQDALGQAGSAFAGQYGGAAGTNLGNSGYQEALARGLGATATNAYANQYNANAQQRLQASALAPGLAAQPLQSYIQALSGQGGSQTTQQTPYFTNPLASLLGAGVGAGALYNGMGGSGGLGGLAGNALSGVKGLLGLNTGSNLLNSFASSNPGLTNMGFTGDVGSTLSGGGTGISVPDWFGQGFESGSGAAAATPAVGGDAAWGVNAAAGGDGLAGGLALGPLGIGAAFGGLLLNDMFGKGEANPQVLAAHIASIGGPEAYAREQAAAKAQQDEFVRNNFMAG